MAGPVLGVDRVVLNGRVQPQAVALLAVVEGALQGNAARGGASPAASSAPAATACRRLRLVLISLGLILLHAPLGPFGALALRRRLGLGAFALGLQRGRLELCGDQGVVLGAEIDLIVEVARARTRRGLLASQVVLALELLDLLHGDFELVGDPSVGTTLAYPGADLVELWTERLAWHGRSGRLAHGRSSSPRRASPPLARPIFPVRTGRLKSRPEASYTQL